MANKYWLELRKELAEEVRYCYDCGKLVIEPPHHFLFGNRFGRNTSNKVKKFVTSRYNLIDLCLSCHQNPKDKEVYLAHNIKQYGSPRILEWLDTCPDKMRNSKWEGIRNLVKWNTVGKNWQPGKTGGVD